MKAPPVSLAVLVSLMVFQSACKRHTAPAGVNAPPPAPPTDSLPAPPPPKPACKSLDERCLAAPETMLDIGTTSTWFRPPASWTYAKEDSFSIAFAPDSNAVLAFTTAASSEPEAVIVSVQQLLTRLSVAKIQANTIKARLKKPDTVVPSEGLELKLWEIERKNAGVTPELNGKPGSLLVVLTTAGDHTIVGAGFVVKPEAEAQASAIMTAVQSLRGSK